MINEKNKTIFCQATAYWNSGDIAEFDVVPQDNLAAVCEDIDDVAETRDTVDGFIQNWGEPHQRLVTPHGELLVWENLQAAKGCRRGDAFVMDFGDARAAYFTGETA